MRVLIVDDDRDARDLLRRLVGKQGHPTEGEALYAAHSRGMMLSRLYADSVEYQGLGNVVRLVKRL